MTTKIPDGNPNVSPNDIDVMQRRSSSASTSSNRRPVYRGFYSTGVGRLVIGMVVLAILSFVVVEMIRYIQESQMSARKVDLSGPLPYNSVPTAQPGTVNSGQ